MTAGTVSREHLAEHAHDPSRGQQVGVILLISADAAFVLSLAFTYFYLRGLNTENGWIPAGSHTLSPANGWIIAAVVVLSALAYRWGDLGIQAANQRRLMTGTALAMLLLLADLGLQIWRMTSMPFGAGTGSYASTVLVMAGAHVVHLLITALLGVAILNRARRGLISGNANWHVRLVGYWWYWVATSAVLIAFTTSFVASPHVG